MTDLLVAKPDGYLLHSKRVGSRATHVIGRHPKSEIVISHDRISRRHALVFEHESNWYAVDLDSKAGLESPSGPTKMHRFDPKEAWVNLGPVVIWVDGMTPPIPSRTPTPIQRQKPPVVRTRADFVDRDLEIPPPKELIPLILACRSTNPAQPEIRLLDLSESDRVLIGRDPTCDLVIEDESVADLAWLLYRENGHWTMADLREDPDHGEPLVRRSRLQTGNTITAGSVLITVASLESAIPRRDESEKDGIQDEFDVPNLGSIFDDPPTVSDLEDPEKPRNPMG